MTTKTKEGYELWKAHNLSEAQSILLHDLCERAFEAGRKASEAEIADITRKNHEFVFHVNELEQTIQQQKELIEEFVQISEHAIDLGYLGEGSTKGEFQKIIEKAKELLK